jgi:hypothetical protein
MGNPIDNPRAEINKIIAHGRLRHEPNDFYFQNFSSAILSHHLYYVEKSK